MKISPDSIRDLVRYYEEDGDEAMLPTAYYYAGRVYSDLNEAPISLSYFQKSLDAIDNKGINDLQLKSVIYSQMGYLYLFQYIYVTEARLQLDITQHSIKQAKENLRLNRDFYRAGTSKMSDLLEAQLLYQQAMDHHTDAIANYQLKLLDYRQAIGE